MLTDLHGLLLTAPSSAAGAAAFIDPGARTIAVGTGHPLRRWLAGRVFRAVLIERQRVTIATNPLTPMIEALDAGASLIVHIAPALGGVDARVHQQHRVFPVGHRQLVEKGALLRVVAHGRRPRLPATMRCRCGSPEWASCC